MEDIILSIIDSGDDIDSEILLRIWFMTNYTL
jgi:hypothetical protein